MKDFAPPLFDATLFDATHYTVQLAGQQAPKDPLRHYCEVGCREGLSPSPYFDLPWYRLTNRDLDDFGGNVLAHYEAVGRARGSVPHPAFQARWYEKTYLGDASSDTDAFLHYVTTGWRLGNRPNPLFWPDHYTSSLSGEHVGQIDPFLHFILGGWRQGNPNPLFDVKHYPKDASVTPDPLSHYMHVGWRQGISPHPLFDQAHVLQQLGLAPEEIETSPLELFVESDRDLDPHPLFSSAFYRTRLEAVKASCPSARPAVFTYLTRGPLDLCDPHPLFSKSYYYEQAPDVQESGIDALVHFLQTGSGEGRSFHPLFSTDYYRKSANPEAGDNLLLHYLNQPAEARVDCRAPEDPDQAPRPLPGARRVLDMPTDRVVFAEPEAGLHNKKIGAFLHIFYPDLAPEMLEAVNNIPGDCTVYISTDCLIKMNEIRHVCETTLLHPFEIRVLENRGRDIAPMLVGFADRLREVDLGVHIHSKRSRHYAREFEAWRRHLIEGNLGSPELVKNILGLLAHDEIGAVCPEHFYPIRNLIQWGGNFESISGLLSLMGEEIHRDTTLDFPSGSMFWFKIKALMPLLNLGLTLDHFDFENGQVDGTLAHAIERAFFFVVAVAGDDYAVINPRSDLGKPCVAQSPFIGNRFFISDKDKGPLRRHYPECTRFLVRPSPVDRPRINLLIPTVDTGKAYAGVATALDTFAAIRNALGDEFDSRMIATDMSPGNQYCPPEGFEVQAMTDGDMAGTDTVVDAACRYHSPLFVRRNDIFLSTAWWTAMNGFDLGQQQAALFGSDRKPMAYLIQDDECGFYAWSTKHALADATYRQPERTIPIFNTELLFDDFRGRGYFNEGHVLQPRINPDYGAAIQPDTPKEKFVLLYARPHAERNCLPFLDALISEVTTSDPALWDGWRFLAVGEDFDSSMLASKRITVLGRLSIEDYARLSSQAALAVSLMISPHPSYPPLEMAEAGVRVLTNTYGRKDLAALHENIQSFETFSVPEVADQLNGMARSWMQNPATGWAGQPRVDWFFGGKSNLGEVAEAVARKVRRAVG